MPRLRVLEIGSGHNPHPSSTVLVDKYLDPREREGPLIKDRPTVIADAHSLPFGEGTFDLAIARQVLEHSDDPIRFVSEMGRVARRCRIETPSPLTETLFRIRSFHRWAIDVDHHGLICWPIDLVEKSARHGSVFEALYERNAFVYLLVRGRPDVFLTTFEGPTPRVRMGTESELRDAVERGLAELVAGSRLHHLLSVRNAAWCLAKSQLEGSRFARKASVLLGSAYMRI